MKKINQCQGCNKQRKKPRKVECMIVRFKTNEQTKNCPCNECILKVNCSVLCDKLISYYFKTGNEK